MSKHHNISQCCAYTAEALTTAAMLGQVKELVLGTLVADRSDPDLSLLIAYQRRDVGQRGAACMHAVRWRQIKEHLRVLVCITDVQIWQGCAETAAGSCHHAACLHARVKAEGGTRIAGDASTGTGGDGI